MIRLSLFGFLCLQFGQSDSYWAGFGALILFVWIGQELRGNSAQEKARREKLEALQTRIEVLITRLHTVEGQYRRAQQFNQRSRSSFTTGAAAHRRKRPEWMRVLGIKAGEKIDSDELTRRYRALAKKAHPDNGGSDDKFQTLNDAYEQAKKVVA